MSDIPTDEAPWLLTGATAAVGKRLFARLLSQGRSAVAISRQRPASPAPGTRWLQCDLYRDDASRSPLTKCVLSAGPLDGLAAWSANAHWPPGTRLIALSSLSIETKQVSQQSDERELVRRLCLAEAMLQDLATARGWHLALLRASLIYDPLHRHLSLDRLSDLAQRLGFLPLPADAVGLRQPVHADDLAKAMLALAQASEPVQGVLRLSGGETLAFNQMVSRYLQEQLPPLCVRPIPMPLSRLAEELLRYGSARHRLLASQLLRSRSDLVVARPDWRETGVQPRSFMASEKAAETLY